MVDAIPEKVNGLTSHKQLNSDPPRACLISCTVNYLYFPFVQFGDPQSSVFFLKVNLTNTLFCLDNNFFN